MKPQEQPTNKQEPKKPPPQKSSNWVEEFYADWGPPTNEKFGEAIADIWRIINQPQKDEKDSVSPNEHSNTP